MTEEQLLAEIRRRLTSKRRSDAIRFLKPPLSWMPFLWGRPEFLQFWAFCDTANRVHWSEVRKKVRRWSQPEWRAEQRKKNQETKAFRKEYYAKRREDPAYVAEQRERSKTDFQKRKARIYAYRKKRRKEDPQYQIGCNLRTVLYQHLGRKTQCKESRLVKLVGCSMAELKAHLQSQFVPGMSWRNYGRGPGKWTVDHIRPVASFQLACPEQVKACFSWKNMRPMWWEDNLAKSDKFVLHPGFK